jgi:hypothetical protein
MPRIVIAHAVVDVQRWLKFKQERAEVVNSFGSNATDYIAQDGSNNVAVCSDARDIAEVEAMLASLPPDVAKAMEEHGVITPIKLYVEA